LKTRFILIEPFKIFSHAFDQADLIELFWGNKEIWLVTAPPITSPAKPFLTKANNKTINTFQAIFLQSMSGR
jgi:hypothetical protein